MKKRFVILAPIFLTSIQLRANAVNDCLVKGLNPQSCLSLNPVSNAGTIRESEMDKLKATLNTPTPEVNRVIDSKIILTEHSHVHQISSLIESDSSTIITDEDLLKAKENFKKIVRAIADEGAPELQRHFKSQTSQIESNIDKLNRNELVSRLTVLVDMASAVDQTSIASRANGILFSIAPITSSYIENELSPGLVSKSFDFDIPLNLQAGGINLSQKIFARNDQDNINVPSMFDTQDDLRNSLKSISNRKRRQHSFTSHVSGIRVDRAEMYSANANPGKFTEKDRMVSAFWKGLERVVDIGGPSAAVGTFIAGPWGYAGGALIGGSAGFVGGFMEGYSYPEEKWASGISVERIQEMSWDWDNMTVTVKSGTIETNHATGNKTSKKVESEVIHLTVLPKPKDGENPLPKNVIDAPAPETADCEGTFCGPKEVIGCDKPDDYDSEGNGNRGSEDTAEELKEKIRSVLNPYIITADGESFADLLSQKSGQGSNTVDPKESLINWGIDGKPEKLIAPTQKPRIDPLLDPVKLKDKFKSTNFK